MCVCVSLFCSCVRCLVRELRKFFCYLNHVSLSKQHLPIQARQQLPHLLPRLLQRPEAVATVSLPCFFLLLLVLLCALWPQTSRRSLFLASCQVAISSRKNICAPFTSLLLLLLLLSVLLLLLLLLSLCNFRCVLREHKTFHRSIRNCWTLFDYAVLCFCCSWSFRVLLSNICQSERLAWVTAALTGLRHALKEEAKIKPIFKSYKLWFTEMWVYLSQVLLLFIPFHK